MKSKIDNILDALKGVKVSTWVRLVLLFVSFINLGLTSAGKPVINLDNEELNSVLSVLFAFLVGVLNYWKNNSFTKSAQIADEYLHSQGFAQEESLLEQE